MTQDQLFFWLQYDGLVRAIDLPMEYKLKDRRICCVNKNCTNMLRDKCLFWQRFLSWGKVIGSEGMRWAFQNTKIYQNGIEQSFSNDEARKEWMEEHCAEYGFVRRYKEDKVDITKVSNEAWHFRYVGRPHATYMNEHNLCLEEYIDELKKHTVDDPIEIEAGGTYRIYYSELDYIRTPENDFEVSGNNVDGYIITEKLGA